MEDSSQQTDESSESEIIETWCSRIWPYIWPLLLFIIFIGFALLIAIISKGARRDRDSPPHPQKIKKVADDLFNTTSVDKYPFIGALISEKPYLFLCTVVVLTNRYLLTQAQCFTTNFPNLWIKVGSNQWDSKGNQYKVQAFIIHEEYNGASMENNVALIRVKRKIIMGKNVKLVDMEETMAIIKEESGIVVGWTQWPMADRRNLRLVEQKLFIWEAAKCRKYLGNETSSKFICASLHNTLCNLDVTGPLIVDGKLVGLWSGGLSCTNTPSLFTNFHYFKTWIWSKI